MLPVEITGTGVYAPGKAISNLELKALAGIEFDHERTEEKLGIKQRHIAHLRGIDETTADFATKAAQNALKAADTDAEDVGLIIVGTDTPEFITPATSILVQGRLQKKEQWTSSFDVAASCASFSIALDNAARIMATDETIQYALVIGVYNMPAYVREGDAFGYSIFADGAGAVVLKRNEAAQYINSQLLTDGTQWDYIGVYAGGTRNPVTEKVLKEEKQGLLNLQRLPGDRNIRLWPMVVNKLVEKAGMKLNQIDHFIFTQINQSVIKEVMQVLEQPEEKAHFIMDRYGYTGSGCVPMTFHHGVSEGKIKKGDTVLFMASGAGLAVGSNLFKF